MTELLHLLDETLTGAIFSEDHVHRFALWRLWSRIHKPLLFIGLNPSTADQSSDDPTIARCVGMAYREGFGGLLVGNLYSLVSSDPKALLQGNSLTSLTDAYLQALIDRAGQVLCGWGSFKEADKRSSTVLSMIPDPYCLGTNGNGQPKHPLYISYAVKMVKYKTEGLKHEGMDS